MLTNRASGNSEPSLDLAERIELEARCPQTQIGNVVSDASKFRELVTLPTARVTEVYILMASDPVFSLGSDK